MIRLPPDFKEFLQLLNSHQVEYLLIGGYAVGYYGYLRSTADMDIWIAIHHQNAQKMVTVLKEFGFDLPDLSPDLFLQENKVIRNTVRRSFTKSFKLVTNSTLKHLIIEME